MNLRVLAITSLFLGASLVGAQAQSSPPTLFVGDPAPALEVSSWVKGDKIEKLDPEKNYVVEFWATWCGPCKTSIPHISELATKYKDQFTFIGVSINERDPSAVGPFVTSMGDKMAYHVATDMPGTGDAGRMSQSWFSASGQNGIPSAFVVVKGKIAWIGHPMQLDEPLEQIAAGKFDFEGAAKEYREDLELQGPLDALAGKVGEAMKAQDYAAALKAIDEGVAAHPKLENSYAGFKFQLLLAKKDYAAASEYGNKLVDGMGAQNAQILNHVAWSIVDPEPARRVEPANRDMALARKAAEKAVELTEGEDPMILDTLALVLFESGDKAKALELQEKAVKLAGEGGAGEGVEAELKQRLEQYRKAAETK